jgi:pilus assembly protein CpaB
MRQRRVLVVLALAIVMAGVAGFSTLRYLSTGPVAAVGPPDTRKTQVVVAARDLPVGAYLAEGDVRVVEWPADEVPAGYVTQPADAIGRGLITAVNTNEPLLDAKLAQRGSGAGLPIVIPEGMRAMSIAVDQVVGVAGFVLPGTRVDVLLTIKPPGQTETVTQIILQNLTVLTAGQVVQRDEQGEPILVNVVTLMVDPEQAERLSLATSQGRIQLALRNMLDVDDATTRGIRVSGLLDRTPQTGRAVVRRPTRSNPVRPRESALVEVIKGGEKSVERF